MTGPRVLRGRETSILWFGIRGVWMAKGVLGMTPKLGKRKTRGDDSSKALPNTCSPFAKHKLAHVPITHKLPLLLLRGGTQLSMCTTADTQSRTRHRKLNQVGLLDNKHHPAQGTSMWELFHSPHSTGLRAEQQPVQQGAAPGLDSSLWAASYRAAEH